MRASRDRGKGKESWKVSIANANANGRWGLGLPQTRDETARQVPEPESHESLCLLSRNTFLLMK